MVYVIDILKWLQDLLKDGSVGINKLQTTSTDISSEACKALEAWEGLKKYKGIIRCNIDEKAELANARNEKHADFD